jgi:hypothetical protein
MQVLSAALWPSHWLLWASHKASFRFFVVKTKLFLGIYSRPALPKLCFDCLADN